VNAAERELLDAERTRLVLAVSSMTQVAAAAAHLSHHGAEMNGDAVRVMQTGIVVTYARAYASARDSNLGVIGGRLGRPGGPALAHLHAELLARRGEGRAPVDPAVYPAIERLATVQRERLQARLDEVERELGIERMRPA